ncbi:hypothetical protein NQ176_g2004 [Zarea fungicola]|uniref:Uncharacterized protein n=1 Tax=Zarea fungicola TaxID=93591 RepID=A0ACC1NRB9_9HYPO|nr:hypothetical protein NQ176_g2004 [Lecanicillium fungicola]
MRYIFKDHFMIAAQRERQHKKYGAGSRRRTVASPPPPCPEMVTIGPLPTRHSSAGSDISRSDTIRDCTEALAGRFSAALKIEYPQFDLSSLADWLPQVPERLGASDLLDKAALAFLDAFDFIRGNADNSQDQASSPYSLAAAFMLSTVHKWTSKSCKRYMSHLSSICTLLNSTVNEDWGDCFTHACIESIVNPSLVIDRRCLQRMKYEPAVYLALDEENGQVIESLDLPFLVRLSHLLHAPEAYSREIINNYERLKTEWPFTRRRYQSLAGISKIAGISLVLNACLLAMDPMNVDLQLDALSNGHEAVQVSRQLLEQLPKGAWFTPVALVASWVATDDPDINCDVFAAMREHGCYWADPSYMDEAKVLKKQLLQLRAKASMEQNSSLLSNFGLCLAYGGQGPHQQGNPNQDSSSLQTSDIRNSLFSTDPRTAAFSGQLSPISDVCGWNPYR